MFGRVGGFGRPGFGFRPGFRSFGFGFGAPFLLGGITGAALARPYPYPYYY